MDEFVAAKLAEWNMTSLRSVFEQHQIDQESLLLLDKATVRELVEPIGPRTKLWKRIQELQNDQTRFQQELRDSLWPIPVNVETSQGSQPQEGAVSTVVVVTDDTLQPGGSTGDPVPHTGHPAGTLEGNGQYLPVEKVFELMLAGEASGHTVPPGAKENVYFVLSMDRKFRETYAKDDYGWWKTTSLKRHHYIVNTDNFQQVEMRDGLYYEHGMLAKGEPELDPQPDPGSVMINMRRYMKLRSDRSCRKRVSTIVRSPDHLSRVKRLAVVEYTRVDRGGNGPIDNSSPSVDDDVPMERVNIPGMIRGSGKFLDMKKVVETMLTSEPIGTVAPRGIKEDIYFVVDNSENVHRQQNNKRALYTDDCGTWGDSSAKTHHYIISEEKFRYVDLKDGLYTTGKKPIPVDPQPAFGSVLTCRKYYQMCKRDKNYRKRVTTILHCPPHLDKVKHLAVMEYVGAYPGPSQPHGNAKESRTSYIRGSPARRAPIKRRLPEYDYS